MTKQRRAAISKALSDYITKESEAREALKAALEPVLDEEREAYEAMPESFKESVKGEDMEEGIDALHALIVELDFDPFADEIIDLKVAVGIDD